MQKRNREARSVPKKEPQCFPRLRLHFLPAEPGGLKTGGLLDVRGISRPLFCPLEDGGAVVNQFFLNKDKKIAFRGSFFPKKDFLGARGGPLNFSGESGMGDVRQQGMTAESSSNVFPEKGDGCRQLQSSGREPGVFPRRGSGRRCLFKPGLAGKSRTVFP